LLRSTARDAVVAAGTEGLGLLGEADDAYQAAEEVHHNLPQASRFRKYFENAGLNIEDYTEAMQRCDHRLLPNGLHTGPNNWNKLWANFFAKHPNAGKDQILAELNRIRKLHSLPPWPGK
jgi:Predicted lipoprotein of unknown function (DUF2380)